MVFFHSCFGPSLGHALSRPVSLEMPSRFGPRHCGQSSARTASEAVRKPIAKSANLRAFMRHLVLGSDTALSRAPWRRPREHDGNTSGRERKIVLAGFYNQHVSTWERRGVSPPVGLPGANARPLAKIETRGELLEDSGARLPGVDSCRRGLLQSVRFAVVAEPGKQAWSGAVGHFGPLRVLATRRVDQSA